jgi:hypothetical protein
MTGASLDASPIFDVRGSTCRRGSAGGLRETRSSSNFCALEHVPEKWTRFSDKDMLPKFLNWREFFSIR